MNAAHLSVKLNFPGRKLWVIVEFVDKSNDAVVALLRILDLILVNVSHLAAVLGEVVGQASFVAELRHQVDAALPHVYEQQRLVRELDLPVVGGLHVVHEVSLVLLKCTGL